MCSYTADWMSSTPGSTPIGEVLTWGVLAISFGCDHRAISTVCTLISTRSFRRTAPKIAAKLSMFGFPRGESIRCRLLLGLAVAAASASKPTVAFTRSRRMRRAISGSPLRKSVAASSSSALANAGSRWTRSTTVCLKSLVNATVITSFFMRPFAEWPCVLCTQHKVL